MSLDALARRYGLSDKEATRLARFDDELLETTSHTNLVARASLSDRWTRHYEDALQLWPLVPKSASALLDVGSGAGFPGLIIACLAQDRRPSLKLILVDSVGKKARFLTDAAVAIGLTNVTVSSARAEAITGRYDVITARAVTALPGLLDLCVPKLASDGTMIFPKGRAWANELAEARRRWRLRAERVDSVTDTEAAILVITGAERRP